MYSLKEEKISQITPFSVLADNKRIRNKIIDGKSTQDGTPSPEFPIEIQSVGDDVNLFDKDTMVISGSFVNDMNGKIIGSSSSKRTDYIQIQENSSYYIYSDKLSGNWGAWYDKDKNFISGIALGAIKGKVFKSPSNAKYMAFTLSYQGNLTDFSNIKIAKSDKPTPYSEYGKGTVTIEQRGKNKLDLSKCTFINCTLNNDGTITSNINNDYYCSVSTKQLNNYLMQNKGKDFVFSIGTALRNKYMGMVIYGTRSDGSTYQESSVAHKDQAKITVANNFTKIDRIEFRFNRLTTQTTDTTTVIPYLMFEEGTEATDYEPYFSKDYVIPLSAPLRSLPNGTKDTIEEDGIHRRVGSVVLDGSENWGEYTNYSGDGKCYQIEKNDFALVPINSINYIHSYCSHFKNVFAVWGYTTSKIGTYSDHGTVHRKYFISDKSTVAEWKAWLQQNPITVNYELSEEVVEPFTDEQLEVINSMKTFEGVNYFSLAGDLQTTLTFDYNPKITEEIKKAFKYNITKAYLEVAATDKASGFQINEDNYLQSIDFDDCRYIEGEGIIGSCVAKELQGKFVNVDASFDIENRELDCFIGAETEDNITHYLRLGTFIVQKPENDNVKDNTSFDSLDYMIKFNKEYVHRMAKYLKTKDIDIIQDKQYYILTESGAYEEVIVPHKEEISNYYELIDEYTLMQLLKDICEQCEVKLGTFNFRNADYVVHGNRFDTGTTCRDVLKAIAQAAFSWARINEYNELLLDFETSDTITEEIDYNEYYNLSFNDKYGPVNTIVLKNSQVEGENITVQDETLVKNYGIKELAISDNPFAYSEETRKAIIEAGKMLYGFTYVPLTVETIGAAYLNCKDKIKVRNMQDGDLETYLFNTRISYQGTLKSNVETLAMTDTETKYRYDGSLTTAQRRTEYRVDKAEQKMTSLVKLTTEQGEKLTEAVQDLDGFKRTIINKTDETNEKVTTIEETVNGLVTEKSVSGGQNLIKNSVGYFGNDYWQIDTETEGTVLSENSTDVKQNSISGSALKLQAETIYQDIKEIKNGEYYLSFNYKRIINTAIATLKVNDLIINLTEENWKEEAHLINVTTNNIRIEITTDLNSSILITDLMLTEGNIKVSWTQNANESYTDTVQIGKGVRITATGSDTEFVAEATGITINNTETGGKVAEFTKYGTETQELVAHKDVKVADSLLIQKIGNQTWFSSL